MSHLPPPEVPSERYLEVARAGILAKLATDAVPGNRHGALNAAAFRYWQLGFTEEQAMVDLLPALPLAPGFTEREALSTIGSIWR